MTATADGAERSGDPERRGFQSILFAATYEPLLWLGERRGMAERRRNLLAGASGEVLELGAGTGLNLDYYLANSTRLVLTEPDPAMAGRLRRRLDRQGRSGEVVSAGAESLPFADHSFDTVVGTLVLCTVDDPVRSLAEIRRVLRPDGRLLFIEHVRAENGRLARWQDRLRRPWHSMCCGCNCNRETLGLIRSEGFEVANVRHDRWRGAPPLVRPLIVGEAQPQSGEAG